MISFVNRTTNSKSKNKNSISMLRKEILKLELKSMDDFMKAEKLSASVVEEWLRVREKFRRRIQCNKFTEYSYESYMSEEEIIISLLVVLNNKYTSLFKNI